MNRVWEKGDSAPRDGRKFIGARFGRDLALMYYHEILGSFVIDGLGVGVAPPDLWHPLFDGDERAPVGLDLDGDPRFEPESKLGEPHFTLVARDPVMPALVEVWAYMRMGQADMAKRHVYEALGQARTLAPQRNDDPQILSAFRIAGKARAWQIGEALRDRGQ